MKRPSLYDCSQNSLLQFANWFNSIPEFPNIGMYANEKETFDNDGCFYDRQSLKFIGFDWEIRARYFNNGRFPYSTLGQFERKITKQSIQLSIQAAEDMSAIAIAWHNDYMDQKLEKPHLATDKSVLLNEAKEEDRVRYTTRFKVYGMHELNEFKRMLNYAFTNSVYNAKAFSFGNISPQDIQFK